MKKRVLAGMRPTGKLHLGNYLGSAKGMVALQDPPAGGLDYETLYMVADLHGMTTPFDPKKIGPDAKSVILDYLSVGLDPEKSVLFLQSDLADLHTQLAFYFSTVITVARMQHLPTFKEKVKQHPDNVTMALLNYPILMASDILLYKAHAVPVGLDQEPHIEVAREIARKMNELYGLNFPEPQRFTIPGGAYIPSLSGEGKMSKSVEGSFVALTDDLQTIEKKIAGVPTDSGKGSFRIKDGRKTGITIREYVNENGAESLGVNTLMKLIEIFEGGDKRREYEEMYKTTGIRYKDLKENLSKAIYKELEPIQKRRSELEKDNNYIEKILKDGAEKAREVASKTVKEVKVAMGL